MAALRENRLAGGFRNIVDGNPQMALRRDSGRGRGLEFRLG